MRFNVPLTNYTVNITKRGFNFVKNGQLVSFTDWLGNAKFVTSTPIMEEIYSTIANEFAKLDLGHVVFKDGKYRKLDDDLDYIVRERPNQFMTAFDFKFIMIYQLLKYGNAIAFINRDKKGNVISIDPVDVLDFEFGSGFQIADDLIVYKYKDKKTKNILLVDYRNLIHLRLNPNNIFNGDLFTGISNNKVITDLIDNSLASAIRELEDNGTVRGVISIGKSGFYGSGFVNATLAGKDEKMSKQQEIIERIKSTKGGILVLDAGEEWQSLSSPFSTTSSEEIDRYIDMLLQFNGISKKVVNGEATTEQMEVFFNKTIVPRIEQFISEINYKVFTKTARSQGHRIEYYRNPFEYLPIDKAIDVAYKSIQDLTTNERRRWIYKAPPIKGGDVLFSNKNFMPISELGKENNE
jgi:HK97 family phage portal protein